MTTRTNAPQYQSGFGNHFATEAVAGALPDFRWDEPMGTPDGAIGRAKVVKWPSGKGMRIGFAAPAGVMPQARYSNGWVLVTVPQGKATR